MATAAEPRRSAAPSTAGLELTILMPCLNEADTIATCIGKARSFLARTGVAGEILVADNGSSDLSAVLAQHNGARVILVKERGYGAALRAGIAAARGDFVIIGDADDSYDFSQLDAFIAKLRHGCDLVVGNRFAGGIAPGAMPFLHRYLGNPGLTCVGRMLFHADIGDFHCGLRGFRRDAIVNLGLSTSGMEFATEMVIRAALAGLAIAEVPTVLAIAGRSRPPHLRTWQDGWRHLRLLLTASPRWLYFYPGLALVALGTVGIASLLPGPTTVADALAFPHPRFLIASLLFLIGVQAVAIGIVACRLAAAAGLGRRSLEARRATSPECSFAVSLGMACAGFAGLAWSLWQGNSATPIFCFSLVLVANGIQLALTAFLLGMIDLMPRVEDQDQR